MPRQTNTNIGPLRRQKLPFYICFADYFLYVNRQIGMNDFTSQSETIPLNFNSRSVINEERRRVAREKARQMLQMLQEVEPKQLRATYGSTYLGLSPSWGSIFLDTSPAAISIAGTDRDPFRGQISEMGSRPEEILFEFKRGLEVIEVILRDRPEQDITGAFSMLEKWNTLKNALETMPYTNSRKLIPMLWATLHYAVIDAKNLGEREIPNLRIPQNTDYFYWEFSNSVFPAVKNWVKQYAVNAQGVGETRAEAPAEAPAEVPAERVALNLTPPPPFPVRETETSRQNVPLELEDSFYGNRLPVVYSMDEPSRNPLFHAIPTNYFFRRPYVINFKDTIEYLTSSLGKHYPYQIEGEETDFVKLREYYESKKGNTSQELVQYDRFDSASLFNQIRRTTAQEAKAILEQRVDISGIHEFIQEFEQNWLIPCGKILFNLGATDQWNDSAAGRLDRIGVVDIQSARIQTLWDSVYNLNTIQRTKSVVRFGEPYFAYNPEGADINDGYPAFEEVGAYFTATLTTEVVSPILTSGTGEFQKDVVFAELIAKDAAMLANILVDKDFYLILKNAKKYQPTDGDDIAEVKAFIGESRFGYHNKIMAPNCMLLGAVATDLHRKTAELRVYCQSLTPSQRAFLLYYFWQLDTIETSSTGHGLTSKSIFFQAEIVTAIYGINMDHLDVLKDDIFDAYNQVKRLLNRNINTKCTKGFAVLVMDCISAYHGGWDENYILKIANRRKAYEQSGMSRVSAQIGMQMYGYSHIFAKKYTNYQAFTLAMQSYYLEQNGNINQRAIAGRVAEDVGEFLFFLGNIVDTSVFMPGVDVRAKQMHRKAQFYLERKFFDKEVFAEIIEHRLGEFSKEGKNYILSDAAITFGAEEYVRPRRQALLNVERTEDRQGKIGAYMPLSLAASEYKATSEMYVMEESGQMLNRATLPLNNVIWCKTAYDLAGIPNAEPEEQRRAQGGLDEIMEQIAVMEPSCSFGLEFEGVKNDIDTIPNPNYIEGSSDPATRRSVIDKFEQLANAFIARGINAKPASYGGSDYTLLQVKPDGSVYIPRGGTNFEMVLAPYIGPAALENCTKTLEAMLDMGCRVHASGGYHIHVQVVRTSTDTNTNNQLNMEQRKNLIWNFACIEPWLFETTIPQHRRKSAGRWAVPTAEVLKRKLRQFEQARTPEDLRDVFGSRYYALNLQSETTKPTYEFRFPHSNFEYQSANNLMLLIDKIYQFSKVARFPARGELKLEKLFGTPLYTYWVNIAHDYASTNELERSDWQNDNFYERLKTLRFEF